MTRAQLEDAVERALSVLDMLDGDPDLEPSLGVSPNWPFGLISDDRELDESDLEPDNDDEASLSGETGLYSGGHAVGRGDGADLEGEHDGREPDVDDEPDTDREPCEHD